MAQLHAMPHLTGGRPVINCVSGKDCICFGNIVLKTISNTENLFELLGIFHKTNKIGLLTTFGVADAN